MNTATAAGTLPTDTAVNVRVEFEPNETGKIADSEFVSGEMFYLINLTSGYQEWFAATDVTAR
jgi:hypothetical protein